MSFKKKIGIRNIVMAVMLKIMLKMMKKNKKMEVKPPPFLIIPKSVMEGMSHPAPQSELMLENRKMAYKCGICKHKFILKTDKKISQALASEWMIKTKNHKCHDNK